MATDTAPVRNDALARATTLANRARDLRRAQSEVQELTSREVQVLARTAASFFDSTSLPEFTAALLPQSARGLRRIRHRILHRTIHNSDSGMLIRALLLGKDGNLRLFSARSADARDLMLIMEPGRALPAGVVRDVIDWTPTLRISGFRPFEILDKLSHSLDAVEEQIADAEQRVQVQKAALASGDLTALLPATPVESAPEEISPPEPLKALPAPAPVIAPPAEPLGMFDMVEAVAANVALLPVAPDHAVVASPEPDAIDALAATEPEPEPDEWDEPTQEQQAAARGERIRMRSIFPDVP
jgi:hypothetical protein